MSAFSKKLLIEQVQNQTCLVQEDCVIAEKKIAFYLNGSKLLSVMSLPCEQDAHIVGFLVAEGVLANLEDIQDIRVASDGLSVHLQAKLNEDCFANLFAEKTLTSGCCVGVSANLNTDSTTLRTERFIDTRHSIQLATIHEYVAYFDKPTPLFEATGCVHKAMLVLERATLVSEDIGRHSAIDKVAGKAYLSGLSLEESVLLVSGRLSLEMVIKAVMNKIPIVVSKAAATFEGIKAAQELGVTLIGFARNGKCNIYTHSGRIKGLY